MSNNMQSVRSSHSPAAHQQAVTPDVKGTNLQRVLHTLQPGQFGGQLTADRVGGILGDVELGAPISHAPPLGTAKAATLLEQLVALGQVVKKRGVYRLASNTVLDQSRADRRTVSSA